MTHMATTTDTHRPAWTDERDAPASAVAIAEVRNVEFSAPGCTEGRVTFEAGDVFELLEACRRVEQHGRVLVTLGVDGSFDSVEVSAWAGSGGDLVVMRKAIAALQAVEAGLSAMLGAD